MANASAEVIRPLRRIEYDQLVALGAFQDEKIELLDGALVLKSPSRPPHASAVQKLTEFLLLALLRRATVRCKMPLAADDISEPEPDVAIVPRGAYDTEHPAQAHLIIEVAESSLATDRGKKLRIYAACGVPEYWIVNISDRCIEVYTEPLGAGYGRMEIFTRDQTIRLRAFPDVELLVASILK
jgi:Uma2 family endonuclease